MTRRWLSRTTLAVLPAVVISLSVPAVALAQPQNPPPPAIPAQQPPPPIVQSPAERPMRFILTGGTVVIGTRMAEDAEFFTVNTATGLVRVRKSDVSSMDYNVMSGTQAPVTMAPAPQLPPPTFNYTASRPRRPGRGLLIAGIILFSVSYGLTVFGASIAAVDNDSALLLFVPVAGPVLFAAVDEASDGSVALFINLTILQAAGLIMLVIGATKGSSAPEQTAASHLPNSLRIGRAEVRLDPVISPRLQGLALSGHF
jgi:hypothetical protein